MLLGSPRRRRRGRGRLQLSRGPLGPRGGSHAAERLERSSQMVASLRPGASRAAAARRSTARFWRTRTDLPVALASDSGAHEFRLERRLAREQAAAPGGGHRRPRERQRRARAVERRRDEFRLRAAPKRNQHLDEIRLEAHDVRIEQPPASWPSARTSSDATPPRAGSGSRAPAGQARALPRRPRSRDPALCPRIPASAANGTTARLMAAHRVDRRAVEQLHRARRKLPRRGGRRRGGPEER